MSGNRTWIAVGLIAALVAAILGFLWTPAARGVLAAEFVGLIVLVGLQLGETDRSLRSLKRGQKALATAMRDQEIETGLAALNRYATLAGRDLDKTPDAAD